MSITAHMVKTLREKTGAGMMDCKKALVETKGNFEEAIDYLRKRGAAKALKRSDKVAAEGVIAVAVDASGRAASMIELNCETDFVARSDEFLKLADVLSKVALEKGVNSVAALLALNAPSGETYDEQRKHLAGKLGENLQVRRVIHVSATGVVGCYVHGNRIGALVALDQALPELAKDLAMHVTAANPQAVDESNVDSDLIQKEREIFTAQAKESGKPDNIIQKMVEGRIAKYLKDICLVGQPFIKNPDVTVADLLKSAQANVINFVRFEVGEGVTKETVDFAKEVQAQIKRS